MARKLTDADVRWLQGICMPPGFCSVPPPWPPGRYFARILKKRMREGFFFEAAYLMLEPGKHLRLRVRDPADLEERFSETVYHGTSLGALDGIMTDGFRPSIGAGSGEAGKPYNCKLPMVYTSALLHTARRYVGNEPGQRIGGGPLVNCVLWLKADPKKRLWRKRPVKNASGEPQNEQQGYHPDDLRVCDIFLHCIGLGTVTPEQARFKDAEPSAKEKRRNHPPLKKNFDGVEPQKITYLRTNSFWAPHPKIHTYVN